jgi:hypothetical protein
MNGELPHSFLAPPAARCSLGSRFKRRSKMEGLFARTALRDRLSIPQMKEETLVTSENGGTTREYL